jgi:ribosomal protein S18 acetylase RimI-like enzyme
MKVDLHVMPDNARVTAFYAALGYAVEPRIRMGKKVLENIPAT